MNRARLRNCENQWRPQVELGLLVTCMKGIFAFILMTSFAAFGGDMDQCRQLVVSVAPDWNTNTGWLQRFERPSGGEWHPVGEPWRVLYGKNGLAWGIGEKGQEQAGLSKVEHDKRAPAGLFRIGKIYTYDAKLPAGADYPFHTVTEGDAWIDDVTSPQYNRQVTVDAANPPVWFAKQKMRHNDFAYRWLVEIRHNSDAPVPRKGSAIFFHIRRGVDRPTAGCTTMAEEDLVQLIRWLREDAHPHYALLPKAEYTRLWKSWGLPSTDVAAGVMRSP